MRYILLIMVNKSVCATFRMSDVTPIAVITLNLMCYCDVIIINGELYNLIFNNNNNNLYNLFEITMISSVS